MKDEINSTYASIYKFQSAKVIMEQLFMKFPNELLHKLEANRNSTLEILSVCSLDKKKKQSNLTYYLAREYSKHKKVLYINLHSWQILSKTQCLKEYNGISEIIYYLRQKTPNFIIKMNHAVVKVNGLDCIYGTSFGLEVDELTTEDTRMWIEQLQMWNQYEIVVFDVGNINIGTLELLHNSNKIIYTIEENTEDELELDIFKYQLEFAGYEDVVNKIRTCDISKEKEECIRQFIH